MPTPEDFLEATQWMAITTVAFAALAAIAFLAKWGIRFRLVGITGFCGVLTVGFLGLSFQPLTSATVPGAVRYNTVFDSGASQIVIAVPAQISEEQLSATLEQAAVNLLKPSRLAAGGQAPLIRARAIVHRDPGISDLLYLGQIQPGESGYVTTINRDALAQAAA